MTRWRAAAPLSTAIITAGGQRKLKDELEYLWRDLRPGVVKALSAAAAEGDRSENAEYIYRKKQLGEIDRRVRYLSQRLQVVRVAEDPPSDRGAIYFGAWFVVETESGEKHRYRIVGPDETDPTLGWISVDSPLARAALKKHVDDEFSAELPGGVQNFAILEVSYDAPHA